MFQFLPVDSASTEGTMPILTMSISFLMLGFITSFFLELFLDSLYVGDYFSLPVFDHETVSSGLKTF